MAGIRPKCPPGAAFAPKHARARWCGEGRPSVPAVMGHRRSSEPQTVTSHGFCFTVLNCCALSPHLGGTGRPGEPELVFPFPSVSSALRGPREVSSGRPVSPSTAWLGRAKCSGASRVLLHGVTLLGLLESSRLGGLRWDSVLRLLPSEPAVQEIPLASVSAQTGCDLCVSRPGGRGPLCDLVLTCP